MSTIVEEPTARPAANPATLTHPDAGRFWLAAILTGVGAGVCAVALTRMFEVTTHWAWPASGSQHADEMRRVLILIGAGILTGLGQRALVRLPSGNGIDTTAAIWFYAGRIPALKTLASGVLSIAVIAMGAPLGREGAAKQAGAVIANWASDQVRLSDEERRLLVACGVGAGMAGAYGVPMGGALFALEVMRGTLALRMVLPAIATSVLATSIVRLVVAESPIYSISPGSVSAALWISALLLGAATGLLSVGCVRAVRWADRRRPAGWLRWVVPVVVLGVVGCVSVPLPQLLGNGRETAQAAFANQMTPGLLLALLLLRPLATLACIGAGTPGGLFTPTITVGALFGALFGHACASAWPDVSPPACACIGATALLAATTQGPISAILLVTELVHGSRGCLLPLVAAVVVASLIARTLEPRSIYDARLSDAHVAERQRLREGIGLGRAS